ncbi:MAG TPA: hypothetical protein VE710_18200 [Candidatus Bathyarchaeia archaeon]|nr:hypothetical protein [Candidatus Bathyarchaeia archaeon]
MDRFEFGMPDPQVARVIDHCGDCGGEIYEGQLATRLNGKLYCEDQCLLNDLGAESITAGEE